MKKYHVATGDGKGYYGVGYESYRQAESLLKISQEHDPQAHIVEEECRFTNADRIRAMSDEELAYLLAHETFRIADLIQQRVGFGVTEEAIYAFRLKWLRSPAEEVRK